MRYIKFNSPIGKIFIVEENQRLLEIGIFNGENFKTKNIKLETSFILESAKTQLFEYFEGKRKIFNLPLNFIGTDFQKKVWTQLLKIPYGETASYKAVAKAINSEKAVRAVGNANNKNNFLIVVPCHRVIGSDGSLVGYGQGLEMKKFLLDLEKKHS